MTDQEIEKLREKLGPEYSVKRQNGAVTVELADIWKGVEFAECVSDVKVDRYGKEIAKGQIYRILDWFKREAIYIDKDELGWQSKHFKPSTEAAYVEQLKAKAKELYGEIKDGDRFDRIDMGFEDNHRIGEVSMSFNGCDYSKSDDNLYLGTMCIYQQGKWAKKVENTIMVEPTVVHLTSSENDEYSYGFRINGANKIPHARASQYLAKCLEDYLNKSQ